MTRPYKTQQWYGGRPGRPVVPMNRRRANYSLAMTHAQAQWLKDLGEGNRSAGLLILIEKAGGPSVPPAVSRETAMAKMAELEMKVAMYADARDPPADEPEKIIPVTTEGNDPWT